MFRRTAQLVATALVTLGLAVLPYTPVSASGCGPGPQFTGKTTGQFSGPSTHYWKTESRGMTEIALRADRWEVEFSVVEEGSDGSCVSRCWNRNNGKDTGCTVATVGTLHITLQYSGPVTPVAYTLTARDAFIPPGSACGDYRDNDFDGKVDYPGDGGCSSELDPFEGDPGTCERLVDDSGCLSVENGPVVRSVTAYSPQTTTAATHSIAGYIDVYRFTLPNGASVTLPCVMLLADGTGVHPCATAGGTFVTRTAVLVNETVTQPGLALTRPLATVRVCEVTVTITYQSVGVENFPAVLVC